ncbi:CG32679, partial [Drosophila busckii]
NYCAASLCGESKHIACNNNGAWASSCPKKDYAPIMITMDIDKRSIMVRAHNSRRNYLARGKLPGFAAAKRMATMRWSSELAKIAAYNVRQCAMKHDACRNTKQFKSSGQNLAIMSYTGNRNARTDEEMLAQSVTMWWNEYKDTTMAQMRKYPSNYKGPAIGHFTAMMQQTNMALGCAAARYKDATYHNFLVACNYATTNIIGRAVYTDGATASGCTKGKNPNYAGLCHVDEVFS